MPTEILESDWSDYDRIKKSDRNIFTCEDWELDYLAKKIKKLYPKYDERMIKRAIYVSSKEMGKSKTREAFVNRVMGNLRFLAN